MPTHDFIAHRPRPLQPGPGLPDRADRRARRPLPGDQAATSSGTPGCSWTAPTCRPRSCRTWSPWPTRPRPYSFLNYLKESGPAVLVLHPRELLPAARRVQRLLPLGRRPARAACASATTVTEVTYDAADAVRRAHRPTGERPTAPAAWSWAPAPRRTSREACAGPGRRLHAQLRATWSTRRSSQQKESITLVGSGQSAAEIYYDLLGRDRRPRLPARTGSPAPRGSSRWSTPSSRWR